MIYLDTCVALAELFSEARRPPTGMWRERIVSSRLLEYECWNRIHSRGMADQLSERVRGLLMRTLLVDLTPEILARALDPLPTAPRTLDALHLSTMLFLRAQGHQVELATYDERFATAARALDFPIAAL